MYRITILVGFLENFYFVFPNFQKGEKLREFCS